MGSGSKFECRVCEIWMDPSMFSNKEMKGYEANKAKYPATNGESAKLRCRGCAGQQVTELQCQGHCGLYKALSYFSKAQRTRGSQWCVDCILWKEAAEPGIITAAAPHSMTSPDEHLPGTMAGSLHNHAASMIGTEVDTSTATGYHGDNGGRESFQLAIPDKDTMSINGGYGGQARRTNTVSGGVSIAPSMVPPHLRHLEAQIRKASAGSIISAVRPSAGSIISSTSADTVLGSSHNHSHLHGMISSPGSVADSDSKSIASSVSNPFASVDGSSVSGSVRGIPHQTGIPHVGFDNRGVRHNQIRMPSGESSRATSSYQVPFNNGIPPTEQPRGGSWARAAGQKRTVPQFPQASRAVHQPTQNVTQIIRNQAPHEKTYYSDGESADEM